MCVDLLYMLTYNVSLIKNLNLVVGWVERASSRMSVEKRHIKFGKKPEALKTSETQRLNAHRKGFLGFRYISLYQRFMESRCHFLYKHRWFYRSTQPTGTIFRLLIIKLTLT